MASVILALEKKSAFLSSPPAGWRLNATTNKMSCEDNSVTVLVQDKQFDGRSTCININSLNDIETARNLVRSRPILTTVMCQKSYSNVSEKTYFRRGQTAEDEAASQDRTSDYREEYVVLINTIHPQLQIQFDKAFSQAEQYVNSGDNFRVTIQLSESIKTWFQNEVPIQYEIKNSQWATNCDIYLVKGASEPGFADRCFSCEPNMNKIVWCFCFPFWLMCGLPLLIYKKFFIGLKEFSIKQPVPVTYHEGPFQMGFNLMNLLYPPGTIATTITQHPGQQPYTQQPAPYPGP